MVARLGDHHLCWGISLVRGAGRPPGRRRHHGRSERYRPSAARWRRVDASAPAWSPPRPASPTHRRHQRQPVREPAAWPRCHRRSTGSAAHRRSATARTARAPPTTNTAPPSWPSSSGSPARPSIARWTATATAPRGRGRGHERSSNCGRERHHERMRRAHRREPGLPVGLVPTGHRQPRAGSAGTSCSRCGLRTIPPRSPTPSRPQSGRLVRAVTSLRRGLDSAPTPSLRPAVVNGAPDPASRCWQAWVSPVTLMPG